MRSRHQLWGALILGWMVLLGAERARAGDDLLVPAFVQVKLLSKVIGYDRNLSRRVQRANDGGPPEELRVGILLRPRYPLSAQVSGQVRQALKELPALGGFVHREEEVLFSDATQAAAQAARHGWAVLYIMPGFSEEEMRQLARALEASDILTVAAATSDVRQGVVLGFDLVSSKPRLLINLKQARRQNVDFASDLLGLSEVVE